MRKLRVVASCLAVVLVACGGDPKPRQPTCLANIDCKATQVCAQGDCIDAFLTVYSLKLGVKVAPKEPDGSTWDGDGSPPDVSARLTIPGDPNFGDTQLLAWEDRESFEVTWPTAVLDFDGGAPGTMSLAVTDEDTFGGGDHICTVQIASVVDFLHNGGQTIDAQSCQATFFVTPFDPANP